MRKRFSGAQPLILGLGSPTGAMLDTIVDEVLENECILGLCTLRAQVQALRMSETLSPLPFERPPHTWIVCF